MMIRSRSSRGRPRRVRWGGGGVEGFEILLSVRVRWVEAWRTLVERTLMLRRGGSMLLLLLSSLSVRTLNLASSFRNRCRCLRSSVPS